MDHLTLYDSAAMDLEGKVQSAIVVGERFIGSCKGLHAEMRDLDILSARVSRAFSAVPYVFPRSPRILNTPCCGLEA